MIFKGSRYEKVETYQITTTSGQNVTALKTRVAGTTPATFLHTFRAGDRLDLLAFKFYGNPEKFWLIADANPEVDPEDLPEPGRKLLVPPDQT